jgi:hypothetical protein
MSHGCETEDDEDQAKPTVHGLSPGYQDSLSGEAIWQEHKKQNTTIANLDQFV